MVQPKKKKKLSTKKLVRASAPKVPTPREVATFLGVPLSKPLRPDQSRRLLKPYPGFRTVMDNVARYLREDNDLLELSYDPTDVEHRLGRAKDLAVRISVAEEILAGADGERQVEDGFLMKVLVDAVRRVENEREIHPELATKWKEILDFVKKYRPGRSDASESAPA